VLPTGAPVSTHFAMVAISAWLSEGSSLNSVILHLKPYSPHQCKRVAFFNDTGMETVIENHAAVFEMILEVKIYGTGREGISEFGKSQIVGSNQADRRTVDKPTDDRLGADSTIVRIRAVQDLVQKKEHWHLFRKLYNVVQALNLSIEARRSLLQ